MGKRAMTRLVLFRQEEPIAPSSRFFQKYRPDGESISFGRFFLVKNVEKPIIGKTNCLRNGLRNGSRFFQ